MKPFDYAAARQAGYSEEEIGRFLANESSFDYDGAISEGYKPEQIVDFLSIRAPEPLAAPEVEDKRTVGNAVQDLAASFGVGTGQLVGLLGSAYGLTTGDMDNRATRFGANTAEFWEARKTPILKAAEDLRQARIDAADGELEKAGVAIWETVKNPMLFISEVTKQVPNLAVGGLAGIGAKTVGKVGAATLGKELSEQAVTKIGVTAATGSELGLSSADFGQSAYEQLMAIPDEVWAANPDLQERTGGNPDLFFRVKREMATELAQNSAIAGGIVTFGLNKLPGAKTIEKVLGGDALTGTRLRRAATGLAGETVSEGLEEGATQLTANIAQAQIDPNTDLTAGLGQAAGLGALVGGTFGAGAGALAPQRAEADPSGLAGLSVGQTTTINGNTVSRTRSGFDITTANGNLVQTDLTGANSIVARPVEEQKPRGLLRDATNAGEAVAAAEDIIGGFDADIEALEREVGMTSVDLAPAPIEAITPAPAPIDAITPTPAPLETLQSGRGLLAQEMTGTASVTLPPVEPKPTLTLEALASADISSMPAPERQEFLADLNFARTAQLPAQRQTALTRAAETYGRTVGPIQQPVARPTPEQAIQAARQPTAERLTTAAPDIDALLGADTRALDQEDRADFNAQLAMARTAEPGPVQTAALNRAAEIYGRAIGPIQPRTQALATERVTTAAPDMDALLTADTRALPLEDRADFNAQLAMARTTEPGPAQTAALNRAAEIYGRAIGPIQPRTQTATSVRTETPRPSRLLGRATESYSAPELQTLANNTKLPEITRRGAQIELSARANFASSFKPTMTPLEAPTNVQAFREAPVALQQGSAASLPDPAVNVPSRAAEKRAAFQPILDSVLRAGDPKITLGTPAPEAEAQIQEMGDILGSAFGQDLPVVAFSDPSPESPNGFTLSGQAFVNVSGLQASAPRTALHEFKHVVEQIAAAEAAAGFTDTAAQEFTEQIDSIFDDMTEDGKRSYVENFLFSAELEGLAGAERETRIQELLVDPLLRSEMTADFLGNRAQDKKFWTDLAAADPQGFTGFVQRWLAVVDNLLTKLRGAKNQKTKESARVDKYINDLNKAKLTAQSALINYRKASGQAPVAVAGATPQFSRQQGDSLAETASLAGANRISSSQTWRKGRDLKVALQQRVIDAAAAEGIDVSTDSPETREYLLEVGMKDALAALNQNPNAIGWYDIKTRQALAVMSLVHPEIARDENARFAFTWALAVTSNGMKVDQNFELAEKVYDRYKREGVMPSNVGTGTAANAINKSLAMFNELRDAWGIDNLRQFMQTNFTVSEITGLSKDLTPGGEFASTTVKGAAILGPKIGNGFFSNLYGDFTSLTMDRWLIRTWGRWTGTLIKAMPEQTALARTRLSNNVKAIVANKQEATRLEALIDAKITADMDVDQLSALVQKASMDPKIRAKLNETELGATLRLAGNSLAKYLDGQKEAPAGPEERQYIRSVFNDILDELNQTDQYKDLMMADLQAVLWYAEKRLYETAKDDPNQLAADEGVEGYDDESAPDYANAAARIARQKGVTDKRINATLKRIEDERSTAARSEDDVSQDTGAGQPAAVREFTRQEKRKFLGERAILRVRSNRAGDAQPSGSYAPKSEPDGGRVRVLKSLGVSYTQEWKVTRDAATAFRANKMPAPEFLELAATAENAERFTASISENKAAHPFGAAVYVYPAEEYQGMRLFLTKDGKSGVAIKPDGDIVSVFSTGGAGRSVMELAVAAGGRKLDAFDTILPEFYAPHGFRAVARTKWNDEFAPSEWDKDTFSTYNNGEPDVVFMVYDPSKMDAEYSSKDGRVLDDYDRAVALQNREMKRLTPKFSRKQGDVLARDPRLEQAAQGMKEGTVTSAEYSELVNAIKPVTPYPEVPNPAKLADIQRALTSDKLDRIGVPSKTLKAGDPVGLRLDIPAYANHGVWVVSVHDQIPGFAAGKSIGYESVASVTNPTFGVVESAALNIASGKPKATIAVMKGDWKPITPKQASATAKLAMDSKSWAQVGMDPTRHAYFYDRATLQPVVSADEAIQVGPLVLAKNPVYGNKEDFRFSRKQADDTDEPVRIRLGRTDNTAANKALDSLQAKLAANPLNDRELTRKGAAVNLSVDNGALRISDIRSTSPGQGEASELLDMVIAEADTAGTRVTLFADSYVEDGGLNTDALVDWYSRRGFEEVRRDEDGVEMRRYPANLQFSRKQTDTPDIRFSLKQQPFYSSLKRAVGDMPERMRTQPAKQWIQWLTSPSNQSRFGFKKDEVSWSGVEDYLNLRGKDKVTADEIVQYLNENNVVVQDVVLGGPPVEEGVYPAGTYMLPESGETGDRAYWREEMQRIAEEEDLDIDDLLSELVNVSYEPIPVDAPEDSVQYGGYTAGRGERYQAGTKENYREVLITLPYKGGKVSGEVKFISESLAEEFMEELSMQGLDKLDYGADTSDRSLVVYDNLTEAEYDAFATVRDLWPGKSTMTVMKTGGDLKQKGYMSSHWAAPNVLAHLRVEDRSTAAGDPVLFVNEVQSDWGQEAREKGIKQPFTMDELLSQRIAAARKLRDKVRPLNLYDPARDNIENIINRDSANNAELKTLLATKGVTSPDTVSEVITLATEYRDAKAAVAARSGKPDGTISDAPFIGDTESWVTLALKRAVIMAVDGNYDKLAFVNGEQAAEMFDLSMQIGEIAYNSGDDLYSITIYDPVGNLIHRENNATADALANLVGKDLAKKIVNDEGVYDENYGARVLSGLDLKVGGEGMVGFYDGIVPNILRKLAKKFGGTVAVEPIRIESNNTAPEQLTLTITDDLRKQVEGVGLPLFSRKQNIFGQPLPASNWSVEDGKMDETIYNLQDKLVDTKRVLQGIRKASNTVADRWDGYLQETLYHGRTAKRTTDFIDDELAPLIKGMDAANVSMKEFDTYLHNRHAQERNAAIAQRNPALPDAGSGIKSGDARAYLAAMDPNRRATLEALAQKVDAITEKTRQALLAGGLESQAAIDAWEATYSQYVPLMREELDFDPSGGSGGSGAGFSVKGSSSRRAVGSSSRAVVDILANIAMQRERAIVRAEKNRVSQAMYGLAIQNPNPGFWLPINPDAIKDKTALAAELVSMGINPLQAQNIAEQPKQSYVDPRSGLVTTRINSFLADNPNVLVTRVNGKDRFLLFNSQDERANRMVKALKNLDADQLGRAMSMAAVGTRWFASVNTQYNPIFGLINFTRDVQGGMLNLSTTQIAGKQKDVAKNTMPALIGIYRDLRSGTPSQWATLWEDFQQAGGQTGFRDQFSQSEERGKALQKELDALRDGSAKKAGKAVLNWLSDYNTAFENAVRLSAYKVALDNGVSKEQAASLAKNLTVNFNKKGQIATQMGALYAFFNASVQGSARLLETLKGPAGKKIVYGGLLLGSAQALAMAAAGFDEDEPPQFLRERNIIIPIGDKKYLAVPMPLGFNVIPNTGRVVTEWAMSGFENTGARMFDLLGSFVDMFNPIGNAGFSGQTIAPTIADPFVALFENKDWSGNPIAKENFNSLAPTPGYTRAKDTASLFSKELSYYLNLASGGTEFAPGALSPTPDQIDYLLGQITGGLGREIMKTEQTATALITGEDLPPFKIPLFGRLYGDTSTSAADSNRFYENIRRMNIHKEEIEGRQESRRPVGEYLRENPEARLVTAASSTYREVQQMRNRKREMVERGASRESVRIMEQRIASRMRQFNDRLDRM